MLMDVIPSLKAEIVPHEFDAIAGFDTESLCDPVTKVGQNLRSDILKLCREFEMDLKTIRGTVELGSLCLRCGIVPDGRVELSTLYPAALSLYLPKDKSVRASNWDCQQLSEDQKNYAALDACIAWASLQVYSAAIKMEEIGLIPRAKLPNTLVTLYSSHGQRPIAYGCIKQLINAAD
ncbi:hypothetical protein BJ742DRAFT_743725 [Cladochytrium replicatum]|nr:hypothetical protein BJ742DRAFT_743725 [Cladochytrium replicatum]